MASVRSKACKEIHRCKVWVGAVVNYFDCAAAGAARAPAPPTPGCGVRGGQSSPSPQAAVAGPLVLRDADEAV